MHRSFPKLFIAITFFLLSLLSLSSCAHEHGEVKWIRAIEPTCTTEGLKYSVCTDCNERIDAVVLPTIDHSMRSYPARAVSCTEDGWDEYSTCTRCGYTTKIEIPALGHDLSHHEAKVPTCTEAGNKAYESCTRCDHTTYTKLSALGHNLKAHSAAAPSCTVSGHTDYVECTECDYTTYEELPATGHELLGYAAREATCTEIGWEAYTACKRCEYSTRVEISPLGHELAMHDAKEPTCTETGWYAYSDCSRCGYSTYIARAPRGHNMISYLAKAPTCTEEGWLAHETCSRCEYTTKVTVAALGHDTARVEAKEPTCTESGYGEYTYCLRCRETDRADLPALGHDEEHHLDKAPTCTEDGYENYVTCKRCNYSSMTPIPAKGHLNADFAAKEPTCTEYGWDAYTACTACGYTTYEKKDALGHKPAVYPERLPTCTEGGWNKYTVCERCGDSDRVPLDPLGHDVTSYAQKDPTCTEVGHKAYTECKRCGITTYEELPATGHTYDDDYDPDCNSCGAVRIAKCRHSETSKTGEIAPTCTEAGLTAKEICTICGETVAEQSVVPKLGHKLEAGEALAPTCTEDGNREYVYCTRCDYTTIEMLPATGHTYDDDYDPDCNSCGTVRTPACAHSETTLTGAVDPTCTKTGLTAKEICNACGRVLAEQEIIPELGHDPRLGEALAPTCTEDGNREYVYCARCDYTTIEMLPAKGHSYDSELDPDCNDCGAIREVECKHSSVIPIPAVAAGCTTEGLTEGYVCRACLLVLVPQSTVPPVGHSFELGVCTACGEREASDDPTLETATVTIADLGYADGDVVASVTVGVLAFNFVDSSDETVYKVSGEAIRIYKNSSIRISVSDGYTVSEIVIECAPGNAVSPDTVISENATVSFDGEITATITPIDGSSEILLEVTAKRYVGIAAIKVIYCAE